MNSFFIVVLSLSTSTHSSLFDWYYPFQFWYIVFWFVYYGCIFDSCAMLDFFFFYVCSFLLFSCLCNAKLQQDLMNVLRLVFTLENTSCGYTGSLILLFLCMPYRLLTCLIFGLVPGCILRLLVDIFYILADFLKSRR
jgi:hypothetical protein